MKGQSIPAVVMASITFYVGLYHLLLYRRRRQERLNLTFALLSFSVGLYAVVVAGAYNVTSVAEGVPWQRARGATVGLIAFSMLWFVVDYTGQIPGYTGQISKIMRYTLSGYCLLGSIVHAVDRSDLTRIVARPSIKEIPLPFGLQVTYYETASGPFVSFFYLSLLFLFIYILRGLARFSKSGQQQRARPLLIALGLFFVGGANDAFVSAGLYQFVYIVEYSYMAIVLMMAYSLSRTLADTLAATEQRGQALVKITRQAEQAASAERAARQREERAVRLLRQAVQEYSAFLERIAAGDYDARLDLDRAGQLEEVPAELLALGQRLNDTVEALVQALDELRSVQQRYVGEAWERFTQAGGIHQGFQYQEQEVRPDDKAWMSSMTDAVRGKQTVVGQSDLAFPITLRGETIGAIGARREEGGWSEDDVALVEAVIDQLAQTIESLRLLDETQRRAASERVTREVTDRMRRTVDMDTLLQTAVERMATILGASSAFAQLSLSSDLGDETPSVEQDRAPEETQI